MAARCGTAMPRSAARVGRSSTSRATVAERLMRRCDPQRRTTSSSGGGTFGRGTPCGQGSPGRLGRRRVARPSLPGTRWRAASRARPIPTAARGRPIAEAERKQRKLVPAVRRPVRSPAGPGTACAAGDRVPRCSLRPSAGRSTSRRPGTDAGSPVRRTSARSATVRQSALASWPHHSPAGRPA
jgi:hypothetical protein